MRHAIHPLRLRGGNGLCVADVIRSMKPFCCTLSSAGVHVEYARTAPAEAVSVTRPYAIGVAFTPQPMTVWDVGRHTRRRSAIQPAAVFLTASDALYWQRWEHISESVEIWLDRPRLDELSDTSGGPSHVQFEYRDLIDDPIIAGVAARFRSAMFAHEPWNPMRIEALGEFLAVHFLETYHGLHGIRGGRIRKLEPAVLRRVTDYIAANLGGPLTLRTLAQLADQSPFHFAKSFRITTAVPPYTFVTARRMDHAMTLLRTTALPVRDVAARAGYVSLSHFLRNFRSAWGQNPHEFRDDLRG